MSLKFNLSFSVCKSRLSTQSWKLQWVSGCQREGRRNNVDFFISLPPSPPSFSPYLCRRRKESSPWCGRPTAVPGSPFPPSTWRPGTSTHPCSPTSHRYVMWPSCDHHVTIMQSLLASIPAPGKEAKPLCNVLFVLLNYNLILLNLGQWQWKAKNFVCNVSITLWQSSSGNTIQSGVAT